MRRKIQQKWQYPTLYVHQAFWGVDLPDWFESWVGHPSKKFFFGWRNGIIKKNPYFMAFSLICVTFADPNQA
jgi:hypothetical protein